MIRDRGMRPWFTTVSPLQDKRQRRGARALDSEHHSPKSAWLVPHASFADSLPARSDGYWSTANDQRASGAALDVATVVDTEPSRAYVRPRLSRFGGPTRSTALPPGRSRGRTPSVSPRFNVGVTSRNCQRHGRTPVGAAKLLIAPPLKIRQQTPKYEISFSCKIIELLPSKY
jgi:hypothetical protein